MKRQGNLWNQIIEFSNLLTAAKQAQRGKRFRENVLAFNYNLEQELFQLQAELLTYKPVLKEGCRESGVGNGGKVFYYLLCTKLMGSLAPFSISRKT